MTLLLGRGLSPGAAYGHDVGCSVTGGYVYRGTDVSEMIGSYLATEFCTRRTWTITQTAGSFATTERALELRPAGAPPITSSRSGEDADGELLLMDHGHVLSLKGSAFASLGLEPS